MLWAAAAAQPLYCAGKAETVEAGDPAASVKVLIAGEKSDFKASVVEGIVADLAREQAYVKAVDVSGLESEEPDDWSAVVLLAAIRAGNMARKFTAYLDRVGDLSRTVLVVTDSSGKWQAKDGRIDAIAAASKMDRVDTVVGAVRARLQTVLSR